DAVALANFDHMAHIVQMQLRRAECLAVAAVDLQIEERGGHPARFHIRRKLRRRFARLNHAAVAQQIEAFAGRVVISANAHEKTLFRKETTEYTENTEKKAGFIFFFPCFPCIPWSP